MSDLNHNLEAFEKQLADLINFYNFERLANIPDYVIAAYLVKCMNILNEAVGRRDTFFDIDPFDNVFKGE